jgi:formylglycine-generating enzyme required for sulfatase activity/pimeloyl-ACP methyl ester carboxylesterase
MKLRRTAAVLLTLMFLLQSSIVPAAAQVIPAEEAPTGFTSTDSPANLYSISGQVKDGSGNGIAGVTVTATKDRPPLIFIPGVGGSVLKDPEADWPLWPNALEPDENLRIVVNALLNSDITALVKVIMERMAGKATDLQLSANNPATNLIAPDVIRWVVDIGPIKKVDIYGSFLSDFLEKGEKYRPYQLSKLSLGMLPGSGCDLTQASNKPSLFVFPYDWRLPIEETAQKLAHYVEECVHKFHPDTEVDIVGHSMGGLVARRYILDQVDAGKPSHIRRMVTMGTPWLGAPKMLYVMLTGNFDFNTNLLLINKNVLKGLVKNYPGVHELLPSEKYHQLASHEWDYPIVESGWDLNKNGQAQERYTYTDYKAWVDGFFSGVAPVATNEAFHGKAGQDHWNSDNTTVEYHHIVGNAAGTILSMVAKEECTLSFDTEFQNYKTGCYPVTRVIESTGHSSTFGQSNSGDGTVPRNSATGNQILPLATHARQKYYEFSKPEYQHGDLPRLVNVQKCLSQILNIGNCDAALIAAEASEMARAANSDEAYEILIVGAGSATITDTAGNISGWVEDFAMLNNVPGVNYYDTGADAVLITAPASEELTVTFQSGDSPLYVEILKSASDTIVEAVRYIDLTIPPGTTLTLALPLPATAPLRYDSSGDGVADTPVAATPVKATGSQATDTQPPVVTLSVAPDRRVTISAEDTSGVKAIYYSFDGVNFEQYSGPVQAPAQATEVHALADDNVGNRSAMVNQPLTQLQRIYLPFTTRGSGQRTTPTQEPLPAAEPHIDPEPQPPAQQPAPSVQPAAATQVYTAITGADGRYTLANLPAGTYEVKASRSGFTITPTQRTVTVPQNAGNADNIEFTGTSTGLDTAEEIEIPAGTFQMGCDVNNPAESCSSSEQPLHTVYLDAYYIDKYPVTNARYKACVDGGGCTPPEDHSSYERDSYYGNATYDNYPVINVTWHQANAFCAWEGKRLPTEAEWEKAARGSSDTRKYPWGNADATCSLANYRGLSGDYCVGDTSEVGSYPAGASPYGVLDMAGNVWEWVNDWYHSYYYSVSPGSNPQGPTTGSHRVLRGGSWYISDYFVRSAFRDGYYPDVWVSSYGGFRCVRSP